MSRILIVDDDVSVCSAVSSTLEKEGFTVERAYDGEEAEELVRVFSYDLLLLDWNLPDTTGLSLLNSWRASGLETPIIMLTGMNSIQNKTDGLEKGADDYLTKPFDQRELLARVRAVLRRPPSTKKRSVSFADLTLDIDNKCVQRADGTEIELTKQEFLLLEYLLKNPNRVFSHEELLNNAWSSLSDSAADTVRVHMSRLRRKISSDLDSCPLKTVHGLGYKLVLD